MDVRLDGRTAIITGASKGLGLAMAKEFAASGANVAILARSPDTLAEAKAAASAGAGSGPTGKVETFQCDVSKADNIQKTFDFAAEHIEPSRLKGFVLAPWKPTTARYQDYHLAGIRAFGEAIQRRNG